MKEMITQAETVSYFMLDTINSQHLILGIQYACFVSTKLTCDLTFHLYLQKSIQYNN